MLNSMITKENLIIILLTFSCLQKLALRIFAGITGLVVVVGICYKLCCNVSDSKLGSDTLA